jgi:hypothetical protein
VINIHGRNFNTTADLEIQMVVANLITNPWSELNIASHNFDINTGWEDCSKSSTRRRAGTVDGYPANVFAWDNADIDWADPTSAIPVKVTANGICP